MKFRPIYIAAALLALSPMSGCAEPGGKSVPDQVAGQSHQTPPQPTSSMPRNPAPKKSNMHNQVPKLQHWVDFLGLSFDEVKARLNATANHIEKGVAYEKMQGLIRLSNPDVEPAHFYFSQDGALALIYISDPTALSSMTWAELQAVLGKPAAEDYLASRAGKTANHFVYPQRGIALSTRGDSILFVEIFPPTTKEDYMKRIYTNPGEFPL